MGTVKLGKKGRLSLPAAVLRKLGLQGAATLIVEATDDGAVILRPAAVYPIELYTDARIKEFDEANRLTASEKARLRKAVGRRKR
ncbi:MAG: AbrB/MazE/SpoVT family DNA-binding domain-containing protein [Burkholderiales bacterium]